MVHHTPFKPKNSGNTFKASAKKIKERQIAISAEILPLPIDEYSPEMKTFTPKNRKQKDTKRNPLWAKAIT